MKKKLDNDFCTLGEEKKISILLNVKLSKIHESYFVDSIRGMVHSAFYEINNCNVGYAY